MDQTGDQDRDGRESAVGSIGYRLAAPALRARQRQNTNQSVLNFADPGWDDGPRLPDIGEVSQDRWHASGEPAFSVAALLDQVRDLPWKTYIGGARRASVLGAMGAAGFAVVLYQALPRPAVKAHPAPKVETVALTDAVPAADAGTPLASAPAVDKAGTAENAPAPVAAADNSPAADAVQNATVKPAPLPQSEAAKPAAPAAIAEAAAKPWGTEAMTPATRPALQKSKTLPDAGETATAHAAAPRHAARPVVRLATAPKALPVHAAPAMHAAPVVFARAVPPRLPVRHAAAVRPELPRWLTQPHADKPRVLVMSEPPHNLTLPPSMQASTQPAAPHQAMATQPVQVPGIVLPALRNPDYAGAPPIPAFAQPRYSGVYYGSPVPAPVPANPQG